MGKSTRRPRGLPAGLSAIIRRGTGDARSYIKPQTVAGEKRLLYEARRVFKVSPTFGGMIIPGIKMKTKISEKGFSNVFLGFPNFFLGFRRNLLGFPSKLARES